MQKRRASLARPDEDVWAYARSRWDWPLMFLFRAPAGWV